MSEPIARELCPLCGGPNGCALLEGKSKCWCFFATVSEEALAQVPEEARGQACICRPCASGKPSPARTAQQLNELLRRR